MCSSVVLFVLYFFSLHVCSVLMFFVLVCFFFSVFLWCHSVCSLLFYSYVLIVFLSSLAPMFLFTLFSFNPSLFSYFYTFSLLFLLLSLCVCSLPSSFFCPCVLLCGSVCSLLLYCCVSIFLVYSLVPLLLFVLYSCLVFLLCIHSVCSFVLLCLNLMFNKSLKCPFICILVFLGMYCWYTSVLVTLMSCTAAYSMYLQHEVG